ncbi:MAG TPA: hypothetical protein DEB46_12615 [Myxococcales bacterium]|nr:hypothetical protein [Myxococcales bacterium]
MIQGGEQCDDGNAVETDFCLSSCAVAVCGDGVVRDGFEVCDDGNIDNRDGCTGICQLAACGDGILRNDLAPEADGYEECDDGNGDAADGCNPSCLREYCGNGRLDPDEACDDGNGDDRDACRSNCVIAECGDGILRNDLQANQAGFEGCDDGNGVNTDACLNDCESARCGDGVIRADEEECDDGNEVENDGCDNGCREAFCGNGRVELEERCDDGNGENADGCLNNCTPATCGDGVVRGDVEPGVDAFEACDDGDDDNEDDCLVGCIEASCGDGFVLAGEEACDDGDVDNADGCMADCRLDEDFDLVADEDDNCPQVANDGQEDLDNDSLGDVCDDDRDGDGRANDQDCAPDDGDLFEDCATAGCSNVASFAREITPGLWACVHTENITSYELNNSMCAEGSTPATFDLVNANGLRKPTDAENDALFNWYRGLPIQGDNSTYIRTGQKRRGGCQPDAHGDIYVYSNHSNVSDVGGSWGDLFEGGHSCNNQTRSANNMGHALPGVICVAGEYQAPRP